MNPYLTVAIKAAQAAAAIHRFHAADSDKQVDTKANYADIVTKVDKLSEERVREVISAAYPSHSVLGEEEGEHEGADASHRWIVDPLDGTTNYASGFPFYCVSIALEIEGRLEVGVILDSVRGQLYSAVRGNGAQMNGAPIKVSSTSSIDRAVLSTGFNAVEKDIDVNLPAFGRGVRQARAVRRAGSAALDLCMVASGQTDGFWELKLHSWDVAAGILILSEAGGRVTDQHGEEYELGSAVMVSSNGLIHDELLTMLALPDSW